MKLTIDTEQRTLAIDEGAPMRTLDLYGPEAFDVLSRHWLRVAWSQKHSYTFTWLGRPMIQLPEDAIRLQEVIHHLQPDVIVETGVAHGGSLVFLASLCHLSGKGRVIGVDVEIRRHNRAAIEAHPLRSLITLIEGSSTDVHVVAHVKSLIRTGERVLVLLDSSHAYEHVREELRLYAPIVSPGSYLVVQDGVMEDLHDVPGGRPEWVHDNPARAARDFAESRDDFALEPPPWHFNESRLQTGPTHWPSGWLRKRVSDGPA